MKRLTIVCAILIAISLRPATALAATPGPCTTGTLPSGALSMFCIPSAGWNGNLLVYAHGYVEASQPLDFYHLTLPQGTYVPTLVQTLGFAFATTSYRQNGLVILDAVDDIRQLVEAFTAANGVPNRTYIAGVSEGGGVAALVAERQPSTFFGALATCGPIGSFLDQINYFGDFRVLFDYFFPGLIIGEPIHIPPPVMNNWYTQYVPAITAALQANPARALELLNVAHAPYDPAQPSTIVQTTLDVLWYSVFATNDAFAKLGGNAFDNKTRIYSGSSDDLRLNRRVHRFNASKQALDAVQAYETSGELSIPLVTLHTTGDDVIPYWHEALYGAKVETSGRGAFLPIPVARYGHCNFHTSEVVSAFVTLLLQP
jgi:pimeloyl-ACP methyl ester carboxylesterase